MADSLIYLDTYVLQKDMRIRLPKAILSNINAKKGETKFDIYFCAKEGFVVLKAHEVDAEETND